LLAVIEDELERIEADTSILYENWFIETCSEWVVPYIRDLLGVRPIRAIESADVSARAYVANTIAYRRRKGTAVVLEQLARDVTGWPARAVEFFQRLATTQQMNHIRPLPPATAGVRDAAIAELADGPFDAFSHTLEVRNAATRRGRFNVPNIGIYLWRLRAYKVGDGDPGDESPDFASARRMGSFWTIHPVGCDAPLFNLPRTETTITHLAEEPNVPGPLRRLALNAELERLRQDIADPTPERRRRFATPAPVFMTEKDPVLRLFARIAGDTVPVEILRENIYLCEIPDAVENASPLPHAVALDPARGRISFPAALDVREVWTQSVYGFSGDLGGGPYDRGIAVRAANETISIDVSGTAATRGFFSPDVWQRGVSHLLPGDGGVTLFASLREAVDAWNQLPRGRTGVIVLMDSLTDADPPGNPPQPIEITIGEGSALLIVASDWPLEPGPLGSARRVPGHFDAQNIRAHVIADLAVQGTAAGDSSNAGACFINGLLIEGSLVVEPGNLGTLSVAHCSLIPGHGGLIVQTGVGNPLANERLTVSVDHSICAALAVPDPIRIVEISDSIVGDEIGTPDISVDAAQTQLSVARSTFFGGVTALSLYATDCIFAEPVQASRRQTGCVRFSYVAPNSAVPRRYRCQPDLEATTRIGALRQAALPGQPAAADESRTRAEVAALIRPLFVSRTYGDPGYGQLELRCALQIRTGAESGAEMGAFEFLKESQREANLRDALAEYLRFGLQAGLFYVT
jgi:hypothetical protein